MCQTKWHDVASNILYVSVLPMRHIFLEFFAGYSLYAFGMIWLIGRYAVRERLPMSIAILLLPFIGVTAFMIVLFQILTLRRPAVKPCPQGLPAAEEAAEFHRKRLFGGAPEQPKLAMRWAALYDAIVEQQSEQVRRLAARARDFLYAAT
jgi:hypothetical protein